MYNKIFLSSDHGGFNLKTSINKFLNDNHYDVIDLGSFSLESVDYPDWGCAVVVEEEAVHFFDTGWLGSKPFLNTITSGVLI